MAKVSSIMPELGTVAADFNLLDCCSKSYKLDKISKILKKLIEIDNLVKEK